MSVGLKLLASLVDAPNGIDKFARLGMTDAMFVGEVECSMYSLISSHLMRYGKIPSRATITELTGGKVLPTDIDEPPEFYLDRVKERLVFNKLRDSMHSAERLMNEDKSREALESLMDTTSLCQLFLHHNRILDFTKEGERIIADEYIKKLKFYEDGEDDYSLRMGWPTLDRMTGGLTGGDLVSIIGRPGSGKTYLAVYAALNAWRTKHVPMIVSMEMKPLLIAQRIAALATKKSITQLKQSSLSDWALLDMKEQLQAIAKAQNSFWIIDGALSSTVDDVILKARQLRPTSIFVDGAYLLRGGSFRRSKWELLSENAERLKGEVAEALNVPVVITYQFNRDMMKKKSHENVGLEDIAYTDAIGQLSSVVLGLLQEQSVETLKQRKVQILKGRNGESGSFMINWNFDVGPNYMNLDEVVVSSEEDFQYL